MGEFRTLGAELAGLGLAAIRSDDAPAEADVEIFACGRCRDVGWVTRDGELVECRCGRVAAIRRARAWEGAGIPRRLADATFETFPEPMDAGIVATVRDAWVEDDPSWLVLGGPVGRGKTGLAVAAVRELAERGKSVLFVEGPGLLDRIRQTWDDTLGVKEHELAAALRDVDVLVLDDLGKERPTEWVRERLYVLVNDRYNADRRTIVTTNYTTTELATRIGEATVSRMIEAAGRGQWVLRLNGANLRLEGE